VTSELLVDLSEFSKISPATRFNAIRLSS